MSRHDRDIDGALDQKFGDTGPKVGDWEPIDGGIGCGVVLAVIILALVVWGAIAGGVR